MRNRYHGICHLCGQRVIAGAGTIERNPVRWDHWLVTCGTCALLTLARAIRRPS